MGKHQKLFENTIITVTWQGHISNVSCGHQHRLHRTNMSVRGPVLLLRTTLEMWPCASGVSLCVCTERETQGARGLGVGPWGAYWPPVTCKLINMPLSVTAQLWLLPHCRPALFSHALWRGLFVTLGGWPDHTHSSAPWQSSELSLKSKACLFVRHHTVEGAGERLLFCFATWEFK